MEYQVNAAVLEEKNMIQKFFYHTLYAVNKSVISKNE